MIKEVIVNADDFGLNSSVNKAIVESFNKGLINSTTIMANMPGFEEAVEMGHKNKIIPKIGIHLSLSSGNPLTSTTPGSYLFYNGNNFDLKKFKKGLFLLSGKGKEAVYNELAAQIEKVRRAGIPITHLDTHHHIDEVWPVTQILLRLLKSYGIPSMRILDNLNRSSDFYKEGYRRIVNGYIKLKLANFTDYFGNSPEAYYRLRKIKAKYEMKRIEIMVHPDYNNEGILIDRIHNEEVVFDYPDDIKKILNI
jgi:hypothetical protein